MKFIKFLFDFIDHDKRSCTKVEIIVYTNKYIEWQYDENNIRGNASWMAKNYIWKQLLKNEIKKIIKMRFFSEFEALFDDYKIIMFSMKNEGEFVNVGKAMQDSYREKKSIEMYKMKMHKGKKPSSWEDVLNYSQYYNHVGFMLESEEMDPAIKLTEVSSFSVPLSVSVAHLGLPDSNSKMNRNGFPGRENYQMNTSDNRTDRIFSGRENYQINTSDNRTDRRPSKWGVTGVPETISKLSEQTPDTELITITSNQKGGRSNRK